jgi:hypothetical protein
VLASAQASFSGLEKKIRFPILNNKITIIPFGQLEGVNLAAGTVYEGGDTGNLSDDPLARLLKGGNSGFFRYCGSMKNLNYLIITISTDNRQWLDTIDPESGTVICNGDNRFPGHGIHDTPRRGNLILRDIFASLHSSIEPRCQVPPIFLFSKYPNKASTRSIRFLGLCAPGSPGLKPPHDLARKQKRFESRRFWNYRAIFTLLDIPVINRVWIDDLERGRKDSPHRPIVWKMWLKSGLYRPLQQAHRYRVRSSAMQLPRDDLRKAMLFKLYRYFSSEPYKYLHFAADIYALTDTKITLGRVKRHSPDGSYAVTGKFRLGVDADPVHLGFLVETKCYNPGIGTRKRKSIGVKEILKMLSRLEDQQLGVLVTTSVVTQQAYEAIREQNHPVVCIAGADIIDILFSINIKTVRQLTDWLSHNYPTG